MDWPWEERLWNDFDGKKYGFERVEASAEGWQEKDEMVKDVKL